MQRLFLAGLSLTSLVLVASAPREEHSTEARVPALDGTWVYQYEKYAWVHDGQREKATEYLISEKNGLLTVDPSGTHGYWNGLMFPNPSGNPKRIEIVVKTYFGEHLRQKGIYKIEGDMLTICLSKRDTFRPTDFDYEEHPGECYIVVFKRKGR
jgi:uncharacterized protein (TIGR03067 family)